MSRELDRRVAEKKQWVPSVTSGSDIWCWDTPEGRVLLLPRWSEDLNEAIQLWHGSWDLFKIFDKSGPQWAVEIGVEQRIVYGETPALAICKAFLGAE